MDDPNVSTIVDAAIAYAQIGWPVFPLHGKKPFEYICPGQRSHGYKDATTDEETIHAYWTYHKGATIGLATGEVAGIIVLDIDPPPGYYSLKKLQKMYGSLPDTRRARTGNNGLHFFFEDPADRHVYKHAVELNDLEGG